MDLLWKSAVETATKAREVAESVSQRGKEFAEATAEEATKRFSTLQLNFNRDKNESQGQFGAREDVVPEDCSLMCPNQVVQEAVEQELEAYGLTNDFIEFVRHLDYSTFRDNQSEINTINANDKGYILNPWQARHAGLLIREVKEINELRYVLCPKYMDDRQFWEIYFQLVKDKIPQVAFTWREGDNLPNCGKQTEEDPLSFEYLGSQLRTLSKKASTVVVKAGESAGVDVKSYLPAEVISYETNPSASENGQSEASGKFLEFDPDLEEYLQISEDLENFDEQEYGSDLDEYLNELAGQIQDPDAIKDPDSPGQEDLNISIDDFQDGKEDELDDKGNQTRMTRNPN
eukprot:jgi/Picsp_1/5949/NSC_03306-R1_bsd domain-containing protein